MPPSTAKRIILYRFDRLPQEGFVNPAAFLLPDAIEMISTTGTLQTVAYLDVKAVCFASESGPFDLFSAHNLFERRPKVVGLWTRFSFRDGSLLDGILPHNLLDWPQPGYLVTPPRANSQRQRAFLPRAAVAATELRGVVGVSSVSQKTSHGKVAGVQIRMFDP